MTVSEEKWDKHLNSFAFHLQFSMNTTVARPLERSGSEHSDLPAEAYRG